MILQPLAKTSKFELAVNSEGKALLLHMGPLQHTYSWIQFDDYSGTVQLITPDGELQELGFVIPDKVKQVIEKTRTVTLMEIHSDMTCSEQTLIVFNKVLN